MKYHLLVPKEAAKRPSSALSWASWGSTLSAGSVLSILAAASLLSIGSIASVGSALSIGSVGSFLSVASVGCVGRVFTDCTQPYSQYNPWFSSVDDSRAMTPDCSSRAARLKNNRFQAVSRTHLRFMVDGTNTGCADIDKGRIQGRPYNRERTEVRISGAAKHGKASMSFKFKLDHAPNPLHVGDPECTCIAQIKCGTWEDDHMDPKKGMPPATINFCPRLGVGMQKRACKKCDPEHREGQRGTNTFQGLPLLSLPFDPDRWYSASLSVTDAVVTASIEGNTTVAQWDGLCSRPLGPEFKLGLYRTQTENASRIVLDVKDVRISPESNWFA